MAKSVFVAALASSVFIFATPFAIAANAKATQYYEDALSRYNKKDPAGAIIQLKNALQIDGTLVNAQILLGKALLRNGEAQAAEVTLNEALRQGANRSEVIVHLAQAYMAQGKQQAIYDLPQFSLTGLSPALQLQMFVLRSAASTDMGDTRAAMKAIEAGVALDPKSPDIWLAEVPVRIRSFQLKEAISASEKAIALAPESPTAWYLNGAAIHASGNLPGAIAAYDRAIKIDPDHIEARLARGGLNLAAGKVKEATFDLTELDRLAPQEPRVFYMKALLAERNNDPSAVQAALRELVELIDPAPMDFIRYRPQILMLNGLAHLGLNEPQKAKVYLEAFQKVQGDAPTAKTLAQMYLRDSNIDRAIEVLEVYLKSQPADGQALALLGSALMAKGQSARAASMMRQALQTKDSPEFRTVLGLSLLRSGQNSSGIAELELALKKDPSQTQAAVSLATTYLRNGQTVKAINIIEKLVKQQPTNAGFINLLGMARGNAGNLSGAKSAFEKAVTLDGNFDSPKLNLARLDIAGKAYDSAFQRLESLLIADPKNAEAMFEMAVVSERKGQSAETQKWLEKANALSGPREIRWGLALSDFHLRNGRAAPAFEVMKLISAKAPEDLSVLMNYAKAQIANRDLAGAKSTLISATKVADYNVEPQVQIALLQLSANNFGGARYSLEKALSSQADYLPAIALMVDVAIRQGEFASAEKIARDVIAQHPKSALGFGLLGDTLKAKNQPGAALDAYRKAHQIAPSTDTMMRLLNALASQSGGKEAIQLAKQWVNTYPKALGVQKFLGNQYARNGDFSAAKGTYEKALTTSPGDIEILNNLANVLIRLNDPGAVAIAQKAVNSNPGNSTILDTLGWALAKTNQIEKALPILRDARARDANSAEIRYHLAFVLAQTGRKSEAKAELEGLLRAVGTLENYPDAKALLTSLK